eukprot:5431847-Alexandrium_andersonii.AAC.1
MSASLVGSEMCIRDRGTLNPFGRPRRRPKSIDHKARCAARRRVSLWTVSYTHLTLPTICSV